MCFIQIVEHHCAYYGFNDHKAGAHLKQTTNLSRDGHPFIDMTWICVPRAHFLTLLFHTTKQYARYARPVHVLCMWPHCIPPCAGRFWDVLKSYTCANTF